MSKLPMARGLWTVGLALSIAAFSVFPLTGALAKGNNPHKPHSNAFKAHPYRSGKCNGKRCTKPGDGWASRVNGSPESGAEQLTSWYYGYGGLNFAAPSKSFTFSDLKTLQTDYAMTWGSCAGGSPRWQIDVLPPGTTVNKKNLANAKNIFVYFGSVPTSGTNACPEADGSEQKTGNYIGTGGPGDTPGRYDSSQAGGTQASTYTATETQFGSWEVVGVQLVVDGGWSQTQSDHEQQVVVDNVDVNGVVSYPDRAKDSEDSI